MSPRRTLLLAALLLAVSLPVAAWAWFKPLRILAPEWNGVTCDGPVCVEDPSTLPEAQRLHAEALSSVAQKLKPLEAPPRAVFCSTRPCYHAFGGGLERGATILDLGVIIAPESWQPWIVEHEFIHMLQAQELGLRGRERTPDWLKEGMPFLISAPPDHDLPDYAQPWVAEYRDWEQRVGRADVWAEARMVLRSH